MSGRRILLTGGAGFVGSNLLDALVARGDRVTVIDNFNTYYDPAIKWANLEAHRGDPCVEVIEGDICDDGLWQALDPAAGWNAVLHVAARAGVRPSLEQPLLYVRCNVAGTAAALRWACSGATPIPFLFASSSSVYGDDNVPPYSEQGALPAPVSRASLGPQRQPYLTRLQVAVGQEHPTGTERKQQRGAAPAAQQ